MSGIGEVATIIALAETGFSLARALNTYISDVSDANDDILGLSSDIDSTFRYLRDLAGFIERNETTKIWTDDGVENAKKCVRDSERVIANMRKLLKKATASGTSIEVHPDEIDVTKFEKARWPMLKPELEVRRRELQSIKQDIILVYTAYNAKDAPTAAGRQRAEDDLPRLERATKLMKKHVRDAKRRHHDPNFKDSRHNSQSQGNYLYGDYYDRSYSDDESVDDAPDIFIYHNREDLTKDFQDWARDEEEKQKREEQKIKTLQDKAVEDWKEEQMKEAERQRRKVEERREKLKSELSRKELGLAPQQIEKALDNAYPLPQTGNYLALVPTDNQGQSSDVDAESVQTSSSRKSRSRSIWSRLSRAGRRPKNKHINGRLRLETPELLQDPLAPGGVAELKALYYQRGLSWKASTIIDVLDVEIPAQWLLHTLIAKEEKYMQDSKVNSIWKEFAQLPEDYRCAITEQIADWKKSSEDDNSWVLIYVECLRLKKPFPGLSRNAHNEVTGVYIVLKKISGSKSARRAEAAAHAAEDKDSISSGRPFEGRYRGAESDSSGSDSVGSGSGNYKVTPRRASVIRPEIKSASRSRSDTYRRDHFHVGRRASRSRSRSKHDDEEQRRGHSVRTRSRSRGKDSMSVNEPVGYDEEISYLHRPSITPTWAAQPVEKQIPNNYYRPVDGNSYASGKYHPNYPGPPPSSLPQRDLGSRLRPRSDEYTSPIPYPLGGTPPGPNPPVPTGRTPAFLDGTWRRGNSYNEPLSQSTPVDIRYNNIPSSRMIPPMHDRYSDPYDDMPAGSIHSHHPPLPDSRLSASGPVDHTRARFSRDPPSIINLPSRPSLRRRAGVSRDSHRRRSSDSMDSMDSVYGPYAQYMDESRPPRARAGVRSTPLSDIGEVSDRIYNHSDSYADVASYLPSASSSDSELEDKPRDSITNAEKERVLAGETARRRARSKEILARLTTDTIPATSTENARVESEGDEQGQAQVQKPEYSMPRVNSASSPSTTRILGVEISDEPVAQGQEADSGAVLGVTDNHDNSKSSGKGEQGDGEGSGADANVGEGG